ncbi:MAG: DUF3024 domain-containing protein [Arcicella sp.]|nr:DUF3024 domain-containing protein [Arcicella sp.]
MTINPFQSAKLTESLENYIERIRPPEDIRPQLDIAYRIKNQSVYIFEIRPIWNSPNEMQHIDVAKTTFVKSQNNWKVFWMRASGKWESYKPEPIVKDINGFIQLVEEDNRACFWG